MKDEKLNKAIEEMAEAAQERQFGPKNNAECPDCGATLAIYQNQDGRYELKFVKHCS